MNVERGQIGAPWRALAAASLLILAGGASVAADRVDLNLDPGWKFLKADPGVAAAAPGFDDRAWDTVSAPHTYNDTDTFDHWSNRQMGGEEGQWGGRTWYRKAFWLPASERGRSVCVEFEGVRQVAEVYLNGHYLGASKNGFVPLGFDLTPYLLADDGPNVLAVMCDNTFMKDPADEANLGKITQRVNETIPDDVDKIQAGQIPWNNPRWHPPQGGIYRNVFLHISDPLHISLPLYDFLKTAGPYVYATEITGDSARLHVEVPVENGRSGSADADVSVEVLDSDGLPVLQMRQAESAAPGSGVVFKLEGEVHGPRLWEPDYPYLYRAVCRLRVKGETVDSTTVPFGIRSARWTTNSGFFINGRHLKLHGWGQRPTDEWPGLGDAQPDWLHFYTLRLTKDAGSNFQRWGHCAGGPAMIAAGDELGLITDQPGVDGESDTVGAAWAIRAAAFRDVIVFYRNHPSILVWEAGNQHVTRDHAIELQGIAREFDPVGGRAVAYRRADQIDAQFMDIGVGTEGSREIARLPVVEGEYDREESPRRIWDNFSPPNFGYPEASGQTYQLTSEQFAVDQVSQYVRKLGGPEHSGGANWIFSDTTSGGRVGCETARDSGEVDGVRLPKEAYYACAVMFNSTPAVHIIGHWNYPVGTRKPVYVVANGDGVELFVNGRSLGLGKVSDRFLFTFPDVRWEPGEVKAVAYRHNIACATDSIQTSGVPVALRLTPILGPGGLQADGSDVALIDVEAVDAKGRRCPTFQQRVDFDCEGPAVWRGGWNSGRIDSINNPFLDLECGINRVSVRSSSVAGRIRVSARSVGLAPTTVTIESSPVEAARGFTRSAPVMPAVSLPRQAPAREADAGPAPTEAAATAPYGRFVSNFSYSGSVLIAHVESDAQDGRNVYVDRDVAFEGLPAALRGADWVQAAQADSLYSALDFIQISVPSGVTVYVAHDDRLARPSWLERQFQPTGLKVRVSGQAMTVFEHHSTMDESLTLGSNSEVNAEGRPNMYVVFAKRPE
jgi:beta-galactosidase